MLAKTRPQDYLLTKIQLREEIVLGDTYEKILMSYSPEDGPKNLEILADNYYPGHGIVSGINPSGTDVVQAYWVMGLSDNSRNRILVNKKGLVKTEAYDPSKVEDPSLIIYTAMRQGSDRIHVASNGDQTDTIVDGFNDYQSAGTSLLGRTYETDAPNYTPRITATMEIIGLGDSGAFALHSLYKIRKDPDSNRPIRTMEAGPLLPNKHRGFGQCIHTYNGDGNPLPSFDQPTFTVPILETAEETAEMLWSSLHAENRVAIAVKNISLETGESNIRIINQLD